MVDIIHRVGIVAPISEVYNALATVEGIAAWWTEATTGTSAVGKTIHVQFNTKEGEEIGGMDMRVEELVPDNKVRWHFTGGPEEWIGTDVTFDLNTEGDHTIVRFGHRNWKEAVEFTEHCSMKWALFLLSLKALVETGKGKPSPDDIKIDNWN